MPIGKRLREERERLGFNQTDFAAIGGVGRKSQFNYEEDERQPDAVYLSAIHGAGADVQYIVTGTRQGNGLGESAVHQAVLEAVDLLGLAKKVDARQLAHAVVKLARRSQPAVAPAMSMVAVGGDFAGQVLNGDQVVKGGLSFGNVGKEKKR